MPSSRQDPVSSRFPVSLRDGWWLILPPAVMFLVPSAVVQFAIDPELTESALFPTYPNETGVLPGFVQHLLIYLASVLFHSALCLGVSIFFLEKLRRAGQAERARIVGIMGVQLAFFLILFVFWPKPGVTLFELSYENIRLLLERTEAARHMTITPRSHLSVLVNTPQTFGVIAVVFAVGVVGAITGPMPDRHDPAWRWTFEARVHTLQRSFLALSAVLVTSTLTVMLFFQLPAALTGDAASKAHVMQYAQGLTIFWGVIYSLTLVAVFAPALVAFQRMLRAYAVGEEEPGEVRQWLAERVLISARQLIGNVVALLAPLVAGTLGTLLKGIEGAL